MHQGSLLCLQHTHNHSLTNLFSSDFFLVCPQKNPAPVPWEVAGHAQTFINSAQSISQRALGSYPVNWVQFFPLKL